MYDGRGRLRSRLEYSWNGAAWVLAGRTNYVYDGMRVIQERNGSNVPGVAYTRGSDLSGSLEGAGGIGGLLGRSHGYSSGTGNWSTHSFYHADGNGNVTYMLNSGQTKVAEYRYDPFGNTISSSGTLAAANVYRFSSKEIHVNSGLYYYGYRFYYPNLQRWLNRDPLGDFGFLVKKSLRTYWPALRSSPERKQGPNLYWFVRNNALNYRDPFGLDCEFELADCLKKNKDDYAHQMCELGKANNSMKQRIEDLKALMNEACDTVFPNRDGFLNINCRNMASSSMRPSTGAVWSGYNGSVVVATTALGLAQATCYAAYGACLATSSGPLGPGDF